MSAIVALAVAVAVAVPAAQKQVQVHREAASSVERQLSLARVAEDRIAQRERELEKARAHEEWHRRQRAVQAAAQQPVSSIWERLAQCESGGRWDYNGPSGYDGGLQFHPGTWSAYAPAGYPAYAYQATKAQQVHVAELVLASQGWGAWPACSRKLGLR